MVQMSLKMLSKYDNALEDAIYKYCNFQKVKEWYSSRKKTLRFTQDDYRNKVMEIISLLFYAADSSVVEKKKRYALEQMIQGISRFETGLIAGELTDDVRKYVYVYSDSGEETYCPGEEPD